MKSIRYISDYLGVLVLMVAALSVWVPESFLWIETKTINPLLGVIMFGMGLTLSPKDFRIVLSRPKDILIGCLAQYTVMPLLALGLTWAFSLPKELALGVILVGCCPGGTASNVITYLAKGDLALSVGMTATSTLLAPLLTPLLVWLLAGTMVEVDTLGMLLSIVYVVIAPIVAGLFCQRFMPAMKQRVMPYLPAFSSLTIAFVVGIVVSHNADRLLAGGMLVVLVVILHNLFGLGMGYLAGRLLGLPEPKKRAISIEVGMQNSGLASSLASLHFAAYPFATIPGAVFSVWHNISGAIVARLYTRRRRNRLVLFDLDGTLLDTLDDLSAAVNYAMAQRGFPLHSHDEYMMMVGNGVRNLVKRALPEENKEDDRLVDEALKDFKTYYTNHIDEHTHPFAGIEELLEQLHNEGVQIAVVSNKFQEGTERLIKRFFPNIPFVAVLGNRPGFPLKPDPAIIEEVLQLTGIRKEAALMVGDSQTDMQTARNSGIRSIAVSWGYRPMKATGGLTVADTAEELKQEIMN
ncbi:MAG: HAD-IA family hydrolase [Bacteroidaceae bacterium]|nr:HAD-IA family hydrolase [Bacteroidaceae bacterium]